MLLRLRINKEKQKLNKYTEKYGLQHKKTMEQSIKVDNLINKLYRKHIK